MKKMGSTAIGGIIDRTAISVPSVAPTSGISPSERPRTRPIMVATARPVRSRRRLAAVSVHSTYSPVRRSGSKAIRSMVAAISEKGGSSLSSGLAARRSAEPTT